MYTVVLFTCAQCLLCSLRTCSFLSEPIIPGVLKVKVLLVTYLFSVGKLYERNILSWKHPCFVVISMDSRQIDV